MPNIKYMEYAHLRLQNIQRYASSFWLSQKFSVSLQAITILKANNYGIIDFRFCYRTGNRAGHGNLV